MLGFGSLSEAPLSTFPSGSVAIISASPGAFTWIGTASQVPAQIPAVPGSYTWTGTASQVPIQIPATPGAYTWNGTLSFVPLLVNATAGAYSWIGTNSTIITTTVITATPGAYSWAGTISEVPTQIVATSGTYAWTGTTSQIPALIPATVGSYTWTGTVSQVPILIGASVGTFAWAGTTSGIIGCLIAASAGTYTWVGTTSAICRNLTLTIDQLRRLEAVIRLHGLIDPLVVSPTSRGDGTVTQTLSGASPVTVTTTGLPATDNVTAALIDDLTRWYGLIAPMVEQDASRSDGTLNQTVVTVGSTTTVTRV